MTKYRFNIYYTVGQEVIVEGNTPEEAKDNIRKGYFYEVGDDWDASGTLEIDDKPNSSDEELEDDEEEFED